MGRTQKIGLSYFPFDVDFYMNNESKLIVKKQGYIAFYIYIRLISDIYRLSGYYLKFSDMDVEIFCSDLDISDSEFMEYIDFFVKLGLFDKELWKNKMVLTSRDIQSIYQRCKYNNARRLKISVRSDIWLLSEEETSVHMDVNDNADNLLIIYDKTGLNENKTGLNEDKTGFYPQSKVKESKINKSILKDSKVKERFKNAFPDLTLKEEAIIMMYLDDGVPDTLFDYAISEAQRFNKPCAYALKIVKDCVEKNRVEVKKQVKSSGSSYDLDAFEKSAWDVPEIV